ncbi:hypothetical protein [uncultured Ruminococcus sp.]|uniref:hypothetical protein n=1 Tax=uncultured Ruminococcus sp. TaxID=165186 RepID=UPI0025CEBFA4|nr:hypothetical protein [uncultured Ruminococcus sp.]
MPIESCDFSGKTMLPFCSHGGGRFGRSVSRSADTDGDERHYRSSEGIQADECIKVNHQNVDQAHLTWT